MEHLPGIIAVPIRPGGGPHAAMAISPAATTPIPASAMMPGSPPAKRPTELRQYAAESPGGFPATTSAHEVVAAYWAAAEARDWTAFGALLADDVIYRGPQAREQVRGRDPYIRFNLEGFPYDWHLTVQRIVGEGQRAASWVEFTGPGGAQPGLCFFDLSDDGKIALITDFWPEPYQLPPSRAHLVERY